MEGKIFRTKCVEKNKTHICTKQLSVKPYGFRDNSELKMSKSLRLAHIAWKTLKIILLLLSLEQALIFTSSYTTSIGNFVN